jgi:hypothetical protein
MTDSRASGAPDRRALESRLIGGRQSFVFLALVAAVLGVIIAVPASTRVPNVDPRRQAVTRGVAPGGGFLGPPVSTPGDPGTLELPPAIVDASRPVCSVMKEEDAFSVVSGERTGVAGSDALGPPMVPDSKAVVSVPRGSTGAPLGPTPATATPLASSPYLITTGRRIDAGASTTGPRSYVAVEQQSGASVMAAVAVFDNCGPARLAAPPTGARANAHLWMLVDAGLTEGQRLLELDPVTQSVVWSETQSGADLNLLDVGAQIVLISRSATPFAVVLDKATHTATGHFDLGGEVPASLPSGELWVVRSDVDGAKLVRLDLASGAARTTFDLGATTRFGAADVHFAGGRIWTQGPNAIVQHDAATFAELMRIETGDRTVTLDAGADDVWVQTDQSSVVNRVATFAIELRHLDANTGDVISVRQLKGIPATPPGDDDPVPEIVPLTVDATGFWYEARRQDPRTGDALETSETLFRFDGE